MIGKLLSSVKNKISSLVSKIRKPEPHHVVLLRHARRLSIMTGRSIDHVAENCKHHKTLHAEINKVATATGTSVAHVSRVLVAHAREDIKDSRRSSKWSTARKHWIHGSAKDGIEAHDSCAACGSKVGLQVHHKIPFAISPERELDFGNFITFCESVVDERGKPGLECHLNVAHGGSFHKWNQTVAQDAAELLLFPNRRDSIIKRIAESAKVIPNPQ